MRQPALRADLHWLQTLSEPTLTSSWTLAQWETVIRLSRRLRLLGRLAESVLGAGLAPALPEPVRRHLLAEQRMSRHMTRAQAWVVERVASRLAAGPGPLVLLKGSAYLGQDLPIARGRLPSDVDILVPQAQLAQVQAALVAAGWSETELDAHDQRYYREWSHEVPPMRHQAHLLELDLHHNILPPVSATTVSADALLARLQPCRFPGWQVLHPQDQLLHSASHLFHDSEVRGRLRDLVDMDGLARHFGTDPAFWAGLPARARALGLSESLALACHFLVGWLGTPIPAAALQEIKAAGPQGLRRWWLQRLFAQLLAPVPPDTLPPRRQDLAAQLLLLRYHLWRMPLRILLPHLWHKWRATRRAAAEDAAQAAKLRGERG